MESLRIGAFSWESMHSVRVGGISPHVTSLAESMVRLGHEVHIFTRRGMASEYDCINGVHYQRVPSGGFGILGEMDDMCKNMVDRFEAVEKLFGKFDVLHCHDWHPVIAMQRIKQMRDTPWLMTFHSTEWGRNGNRHVDSPDSKEISHREWLGAWEASHVIVTSGKLKRELQLIYQIPDHKLSIIPNGVNPIGRNIDPGSIKMKYGIHPLAPMVLFVGRMRYQKGPDLLVEAIPIVLSRRWDVKFVFVGEGDMRPYCERRAYELGVSHACRFLGYVPDEGVIELMNACDMLCVPSRNEPFGIVVLEAWSAGKPVVGTTEVELINNFVDGVTAYPSPESIAWCIHSLIEKPEMLREMGAAGRKRVEEYFTWEKVAKKTLDVYRQVLTSSTS